MPDHDDYIADHTPAAIRERLRANTRHSYLSDFIYGGIDGAITTFAIVSGVTGADMSPTIIVVLGCANLIGDGFSMAAANSLGVRADAQRLALIRASEAEQIRRYPEGEREEIRQIFSEKGIAGATLEAVVDAITSRNDRWIDTMIQEEHGLALTTRRPLRAASATFVAFILVGAIPLLPFVLDAIGVPIARPFASATFLVGVALFLVGAVKSRFASQRWWTGGLETLFIGGAAAGLAFAIGRMLAGLGG